MLELPWMQHFDAEPDVALDELLRGVAEIAPYERAEAAELLALLFGGLAAELLRERLEEFASWLASLYLAPSRDPAAELWRVLALMQPDRRFLETWYRLCDEAGRGLPETYLDLGILGLRRLPGEDGSELSGPTTELLAGLFRWAVHLHPGDANRKAFQRRLRALMALYPLAPNTWRGLIRPLLSHRYRDAPFAEWFAGVGLQLGGGGKSNGRVPHLPLASRREGLLKRIGREPLDQLLHEIRALLDDYERYAEATGEDDSFVKSACNFGNRLKDQAPAVALALARAANRWRPSDEHAWTLWAEALVRLGRKEEAEEVYWEAVRRFPWDEVSLGASGGQRS